MNAEAVRHIEFPRAVRGQPHAGRIAAVVGIAQRDHVVIAGVSARHQQREIVGFGAGVDEVADFQIARHFRGELLGVFGDVRVQINRGGMLQHFVLLVGSVDHVRMAMTDADGDDAAETVEITPAIFIPDILPLAFHDHDRLFVIEEDAGIQELLAQLQHFVGAKGRCIFAVV